MLIADDYTGDADFVIVGSGIAGLRAAIALAPLGRVVILTKAEPSESNTGYAQGGIAAAFGDDDSPALHLKDTLAAGAGLCDEAAVDVLVSEGPRDVRELMDWGVRFDLDAAGRRSAGRRRTAFDACCTPAMPPAGRSRARCGTARSARRR